MHEQARVARVTLFDGLSGRHSRPASQPATTGAIPDSGNPETVAAPDPAIRVAMLLRSRPLIEAALEAIRPNLRRDGGDCQLVRMEADAVYIRLSGACVGCQLASVTVNGVRQKLIEAVGMPLRVIPVD
ncbi:NifU family protein [Rhizobium sp. S95]|uniref:NifU family protein n=1 Tax=Ciceribacter sichuanensis TaxID=2949647 RepID=A0AAJ1C2W0_9HYPH|nr:MULTISPECIES: NifU family protein [unclassified Ciceribacter]MCM2396654.1 NifU family protein [Ciceribacter sp. S95]MCO5959853.1 NifU family protein [Ciceribacter sp. S101]